MRDSFVLYCSLLKPVQGLSDEALGRLFRALYDYQTTGSEDVSDDIAIPFAYIVNQFKVDAEKYERIVEKRREAGRTRARQMVGDATNNEQMQANDSTCLQMLASGSYNDNDNENENGDVSLNDNENVQQEMCCGDNAHAGAREETTPHHRDSLIRIFFERNAQRPTFEADKFLNFYLTTGWHVKGGGKLATWKQRYARARNWGLTDSAPRFPEPFFSVWRDVVAALPPELQLPAMCEGVRMESKYNDIVLTLPPELNDYFLSPEGHQRVGAIFNDGRLEQAVKFKPYKQPQKQTNNVSK